MTTEARPRDGPESALEDARRALHDVQERLREAERALDRAEREGSDRETTPTVEAPADSWRERLWRAPSACRIGVRELTEGLGVSESWIYSRTKAKADLRLPHAKIGGSLTFKCGEVRAWIRDNETVEVAYRMEPANGELRVQAGGGA